MSSLQPGTARCKIKSCSEMTYEKLANLFNIADLFILSLFQHLNETYFIIKKHII